MDRQMNGQTNTRTYRHRGKWADRTTDRQINDKQTDVQNSKRTNAQQKEVDKQTRRMTSKRENQTNIQTIKQTVGWDARRGDGSTRGKNGKRPRNREKEREPRKQPERKKTTTQKTDQTMKPINAISALQYRYDWLRNWIGRYSEQWLLRHTHRSNSEHHVETKANKLNLTANPPRAAILEIQPCNIHAICQAPHSRKQHADFQEPQIPLTPQSPKQRADSQAPREHLMLVKRALSPIALTKDQKANLPCYWLSLRRGLPQ